MPEKTYHVFIGYDSTEHEAWAVAKHTLLKHATVPIKVHKLEHMSLRAKGLFKRRWQVNEDGQTVCIEDGKPFSTGFSHSRFLVPELWRNIQDPNKSDLVLFLDCDWLFMEDIGELFKEIEEKRIIRNFVHPVYCVQHDFKPQVAKKMHGVEQSPYNMKLWSAFVIYDMAHSDHEHLIPETVNTESGRWLHQFGWVTDIHRIEGIDEGWNFIPNHSEKNCTTIKGLHFTEKGPWHEGGEDVRYANLWWDAYSDYLLSKIANVKYNLKEIIDGE